MLRFGAPLYATPVLDKETTDFHFLTERELDILANKPNLYLMEVESELEEMKLITEKVRNIITAWSSRRQTNESETILIIGHNESAIEKLKNTMPEWIVKSAMDTYATWTNKSREEMMQRLQVVLQKSLTFCTITQQNLASEQIGNNGGNSLKKSTLKTEQNTDESKIRRITFISKEDWKEKNMNCGDPKEQSDEESSSVQVLDMKELLKRIVDMLHANFISATSPLEKVNVNAEYEKTTCFGVSNFFRRKSATESNWIHQAQEYIMEKYPAWETAETTYLVPKVEDKDEWMKTAKTPGVKAERALLLRLNQLGQRKKMPMFITYNREFVHLFETGRTGDGIESHILTGEHDIILIHRTFGLICIEVQNLDSKRPGKKFRDALKRNIRAAKAKLQDGDRNLSIIARKCGFGDMRASITVIALTNVGRAQVEGGHVSDIVLLCKEEWQSVEAIERWWQKNILLTHIQHSAIDSREYLQLLAIYIAPVYVNTAYKANMITRKLKGIIEDKLEILVNTQKYAVFKGAAGTGKTWLLQEKMRKTVRSWFSHGCVSEKNENIIFLCVTPLLALHMRDILPDVLLKSALDKLCKWNDDLEEESKKQRLCGLAQTRSNGKMAAESGNHQKTLPFFHTDI
ncbi:unnamed protein product [Darwinula stevensoni]|uniref:Uncharacterized protein n=1 Tax=Darwinula stevensoni TaxID=69355 RepID=A0A7R8XFF8_9CRUS|nr:unnamed protein product [Darwinula stevensoni]CAG0895502.1 unnamed protein product [Darwinula stevensoni]